jgi:hypothetical protein
MEKLNEETQVEIKDVTEQVRTTETEEQLKEIDRIAGDYRMKGFSDEEAEKKAREEVVKQDALAEQQWQEFVKKIRLYDVLDDLIRRALIAYKEAAKKKEKNIDFKLELRNARTHGKGTIFVVHLDLSIKKDGDPFKTFLRKELRFSHVKEVKKEAGWKFALYESMFQSLIFNGITYMLAADDIRKQQSAEQ